MKITKTREQTQKSETKNRGAGVKDHGVCVECSKQTQNSETNIVGRVLSIVVCVWDVRNKPKTREQTENSETKNRGAGVKHRRVCVECSKQTQNSRTNPKLRNKKPWGVR